MDTQQIIESLSYITWVLLGGLALGSLTLTWLLRQATDATPGFLGFSALVASLMGLGWLVTELGLPPITELAIDPAPSMDDARRATIALFSLLALASGVRLLRAGRALVLGGVAIGLGVVAMAIGAYGWAGGQPLAVALLVQLLALAAVTGGSLSAVILAHWYLVTPKISERPLILTTQLLMSVLALQLLLFGVWIATGTPVGEPFAALSGPNAVFVWLRLLVGLAFPLVLVWMAYRTALTRSMESATGLLYIEFAVVMASTIVAAGLTLAEGLLV